MRSLYKRTHSALAWIWAAFVLLMLFLLVFVQEQSDYKHKLEISLQNGVLFALGFALLGGISAWYVRVRDRVHAAIARLPRCTPLLLASALFLLQAWVFYHTYFIPGWDAGNVLAAAQSVAVYGEAPLYENYFSTYPNNLLLVRLYAALFDLFAWLGSSHHNLYFTILIQCFGSAVAGLCLFSVVKKLTCPLYAYAAWTVYALHIALNPWICILYSDAVTLCLPMGLLWLYLRLHGGYFAWLRWVLFGAAACIAYFLKPQAAIAAIAILLTDAVYTLSRRDWRALLCRAGYYAAGAVGLVVTATLITELVIPSAGLDLKPEMEFGVPHFLMMGLDERHDGSYSNQDVLYSASFDTVAARDAANLARAKERLREMGAAGLAKHLKNKLLVVYADGTYAWAEEGTFFKQYVARPPSAVTDFLRSFYYEDGALYEGFRTVEHLIWLLLFACSGGVALYLRCTKAYDPTVCAAVTALLGLLAYELLFEARARYLFIYGPFFILLAVLGWKGIRSTASAARKQYLQNLKNKA